MTTRRRLVARPRLRRRPAPERIRLVRQQRIPPDAPDWYFEQELRRSGLWAMMEGCYPTRRAQKQ